MSDKPTIDVMNEAIADAVYNFISYHNKQKQ
jgi:hypothetical protein